MTENWTRMVLCGQQVVKEDEVLKNMDEKSVPWLAYDLSRECHESYVISAPRCAFLLRAARDEVRCLNGFRVPCPHLTRRSSSARVSIVPNSEHPDTLKGSGRLRSKASKAEVW